MEPTAADEDAKTPGEAAEEQRDGAGLEEGEEERAVKEPFKLPPYMEYAAAAGVAVILVVLAVLGLFSVPTAIYLIALAAIPYGLWKGRQMLDVYVLLLACALAAVLTAVYFMCLEIGRYRYDIKAREAKQRVVMSEPPLPIWRQLS
jgi:hypothetical protein